MTNRRCRIDLAGVTRRALFAWLSEHDIEIEERPFSPDEAYAADEAFLTSASNFVLPIVEIDGNRIGGGQPGPVARRLRSLFVEMARFVQQSSDGAGPAEGRERRGIIRPSSHSRPQL